MESTPTYDIKYSYSIRVKEIGCLVKRLRNSAGLSQSDLAFECDLAQCQISKLENGGNVELYTIYRIANYFSTDVSDIVKGVNYSIK